MSAKTFRPVYKFSQHLIKCFLIILLLLIGPLAAGTAFLEKHTFCTHLEAFFLATVGILILDLLLACAVSWGIKAFYRSAYFKLLDNRVEYSRDFFSLQLKDLKFKNVKEITLTQGPLQKLYGLGTILLQSHASPQQTKGGTSGLRIYNVEKPQELYVFLKKKIDEADA